MPFFSGVYSFPRHVHLGWRALFTEDSALQVLLRTEETGRQVHERYRDQIHPTGADLLGHLAVLLLADVTSYEVIWSDFVKAGDKPLTDGCEIGQVKFLKEDGEYVAVSIGYGNSEMTGTYFHASNKLFRRDPAIAAAVALLKRLDVQIGQHRESLHRYATIEYRKLMIGKSGWQRFTTGDLILEGGDLVKGLINWPKAK